MLGGADAPCAADARFYAYGGTEVEDAKYNSAHGHRYGIGNPAATNNSGCNVTDSLDFATPLTCNGNTKSVREITVGFWDTVYKGNFGQLRVGGEYEYIQR